MGEMESRRESHVWSVGFRLGVEVDFGLLGHLAHVLVRGQEWVVRQLRRNVVFKYEREARNEWCKGGIVDFFRWMDDDRPFSSQSPLTTTVCFISFSLLRDI